MAHVYLKFLQNIAVLEAIQLKQNELSPTAILLLNAIAVKQFEQQFLNVTQTLGLRELGSPANLHRKLDELLEAGMISLSYNGNNRRTKYITLTQAATDYFHAMSKAMVEAVNS